MTTTTITPPQWRSIPLSALPGIATGTAAALTALDLADAGELADRLVERAELPHELLGWPKLPADQWRAMAEWLASQGAREAAVSRCNGLARAAESAAGRKRKARPASPDLEDRFETASEPLFTPEPMPPFQIDKTPIVFHPQPPETPVPETETAAAEVKTTTADRSPRRSSIGVAVAGALRKRLGRLGRGPDLSAEMTDFRAYFDRWAALVADSGGDDEEEEKP